MEQGATDSNQRVIHFADVQPQPSPSSAKGREGEAMSKYLQITGPRMNETVSSRQYSEPEEPPFTFGIKDGLANPNNIRGRRGTEFKAEDMVEPQDQALLEWKNVEFFVPVKKPPR